MRMLWQGDAQLHRMYRVWCVLLLLAFASFYVLTACLPPSLPRVIKIGLVAPFEGRYRYVGYDAIYAARLAVREINAAGGVGGWLLELVAYDDRADAEFASATARNLVIDPDVVAVIGHYRQVSTAAASTIYAEAEMPLLVVGAWLTPTIAPVWHMLPPPERVAAAMVEAARSEIGRSGESSPLTSPPPGGIKGGDVWGTGPLAIALDAILQIPLISQSASSSAAIFSTLSPLESATHLKEARASGWTGPLIGGWDIAAPDFMAVASTVGEGTLFVTPYPLPRDLPGLEAWDAAYRAVGPHVPDPGIYALPTYEAVYVLAEAIAAVVESGERPSRAGVAAALPGVRRDGALGTLTWDATGYWRDMPLYVYVWEQMGARLVDGRQ
jgi:ABC-type branched-subunit amino acid transport system substrate-binding protein